MLKEGDKLICKKSLVGLNYSDPAYPGPKFIVNETYIVGSVTKLSGTSQLQNLLLVYITDLSDTFYQTLFNKKTKQDGGLWMYFYTPQEIRKMKMKKIF